MSWWFRRKDRKTNILKLIQIAKTWASMCAIANKIENKNINIDWFSIVWSLSNEIIRIIADNIKLNYKQEKIKQLLNSEQKINNKKNKWFKFIFENSKRYWWIKFADFISWKLRENYITEKEILDNDFIKYFVNSEISFIILE